MAWNIDLTCSRDAAYPHTPELAWGRRDLHNPVLRSKQAARQLLDVQHGPGEKTENMKMIAALSLIANFKAQIALNTAIKG